MEDVKFVGDLYAQIPRDTYGSEPSVSLNNQYLLPLDDVGRHSASVATSNSYGVPDTIQVTETNIIDRRRLHFYLESAFQSDNEIMLLFRFLE